MQKTGRSSPTHGTERIMGRLRSVALGCLLVSTACRFADGSHATNRDDRRAVREIATRETHRGLQETAIRAEEEAARRAALAEIEQRKAAERARQRNDRMRFEAAYPLHGVVFHFLAQVFAAPKSGVPIGYLRRGSQFRASSGEAGPGCDRTWHKVPGGGYVCRGAGYVIGDSPRTFDPSPVPPALADPLPYAYAYAKQDDRPQYWRLPTIEEEQATRSAIESVRELQEHAATTSSDDELSETPVQPEGLEAPAPPGVAEVAGSDGENEDSEESEVESLLPSYLRMAMQRGFFVSVDQPTQAEDGREFLRTVRGGYVRADDVFHSEPPTTRGVVLGGAWELPLAIVHRQGAHHYRQHTLRDELIDQGEIPRHRPLHLAREPVTYRGRGYVQTPAGILVRETAVRRIRHRAMPEGIAEGARWIHVDLSEQALVAYDGQDAVFATLVSTGKAGFETPTGLFRIESKHVSITMDGSDEQQGSYSIEDVPWTMYFDGNYALHGAFWHGMFGHTRSHGCINLAPVDARWLFHWATPQLPVSWHGVFARANEGTFVFIEE